MAYNLTVAELHTYFVVVGDEAVIDFRVWMRGPLAESDAPG